MEPVQEHRKFLKKRENINHIGSFFPKHMELEENGEKISFEWLHKTDKGAVVFLISSACSACRIEPIYHFILNYQQFSYVVLYEGELDEQYTELMSLDVPLMKINAVKIGGYLQVTSIPWAFALNRLGQIVGAGIFNDDEHLEQLSRPLLRVYASAGRK